MEDKLRTRMCNCAISLVVACMATKAAASPIPERVLACPLTTSIDPQSIGISARHHPEALRSALACSSSIGWSATSDGDEVWLSFGRDTIIRRLSVALSSSSSPSSTCMVAFRWIPWSTKISKRRVRWKHVSGEFLVQADGEPHCFFLGYHAGIPENVATGRLILVLPVGTTLHSLRFSTAPSDRSPTACPKPEYYARVKKAFSECLQHPGDKRRVDEFVGLLTPRMEKYDCRRSYEPVPAWWLCGYLPHNECSYQDLYDWFGFLSVSKYLSARKLFGSNLFRSTLDGDFAEQWLEESEKVEKQLLSEGIK